MAITKFMSEEDKEMTGFLTFRVHATRHHWSSCHMNLLQCLVYLDDVIVFGRTLEEHEDRLLKVLGRLEECGLNLSIDKCQFYQPQVKYVEHIVSEAGIATDPGGC